MWKTKNKQDFQLGDLVYWVDEDLKFFESYITKAELCIDKTIDYSTSDIEFNTDDIGVWVFKTEKARMRSSF